MDWLGLGLILWANWLIGSRKKIGFILAAIGNLLLTIVSVYIPNYPFAILNFISAIFMVRGWAKMRNEGAYWNYLKIPDYKDKWWQIWK